MIPRTILSPAWNWRIYRRALVVIVRQLNQRPMDPPRRPTGTLRRYKAWQEGSAVPSDPSELLRFALELVAQKLGRVLRHTNDRLVLTFLEKRALDIGIKGGRLLLPSAKL